MQKALLVARDAGACFGLERLAAELRAKGFECQPMLGFGRPLRYSTVLREVIVAALRADIVIVGRSSTAELAEPEIAALEAASGRKPCFMYSDGWNSLLPWFREYYERLSCLFVLHEHCRDQVARVFPKVRVLVSGNPEWEEFFPDPNYAREQGKMRRRLERLGAPPNARFILAPGSKDLRLNLELWRDVGEAATLVGGNLCLLASMHPGDLADPSVYRGILEKAVSIPMIFTREEKIGKTKELVPVSDYVISSFSTLGSRAACQGKRVINYISPDGLAFLERLNALLPKKERTLWPPCQAGASYLVTGGVSELVKAMREMSTPSSFAPYRQAQLRLYGDKGAAAGQAVGIMVDEIERVLR